MNDEKQTVAQWVQDNFLVLILAGAVAFLFYENQRARTNDPTPKPPEVFNAEKAATKAMQKGIKNAHRKGSTVAE